MRIMMQVGEVRMIEIKDNRNKIKYPLPNKTVKYLTPVLKEYGREFADKFNNVFKVAIGIGDIVVENAGYKHEKHLFILIRTKIGAEMKFFTQFLEWVKNQSDVYQDDYTFGNIQKSSLHMIVIKFPEKYYKSFETFKIGGYSKMFDKEALNKFFNSFPRTKRVLIKNHEYKFYFIQKLNRLHDTTIKGEEYDGELDTIPTIKSEKFNHHIKKRL